MTFPTMFMGIGNLVCMPLALVVGRRPVFLGSCLILILGGILAAYSRDYEMHLGVRMLLGIGAGNSEALVPMMWVPPISSMDRLRLLTDDSVHSGSKKFTFSTNAAHSLCGRWPCRLS
jgi:MFS family permease